MEPGAIIHPGIIEEVTPERVMVRILSQSACSTCHAKGACSVSEVEEKVIEVDHPGPGEWKPGQQVMVAMDQSLGFRAVFLGYLLPLIVLMASVVIFLALFKNEGLAALLSVMMLAPYYLVLYLFKSRLKKRFAFRIEKNEQI